MTKGAVVYVSLTSPSKVVEATPEWLAMFALEPQACLGRTFNMLMGPDSNPARLRELLARVRDSSSGSCCSNSDRAGGVPIVLYTSQGDRALYIMRARLASGRPGLPPICKLRMMRSDAIPYKTAAAPDGACKLIVQSAKPHRIVFVSDEFQARYNFTREQAMQRTLGIIQGPETDVQTWISAIGEALGGVSRTSNLQTYASGGMPMQGTVRCTPVVGKDEIDFVMIMFGSSSPIGQEAALGRSVEQRHRERLERHKDRHERREQRQLSCRDSPAGKDAVGRSPIRSQADGRRSMKMAQVAELIEQKARTYQLRQAQRRKAAIQEAGKAPADAHALTLEASGGVLGLLVWLFTMILVSLNIVRSRPKEKACNRPPLLRSDSFDSVELAELEYAVRQRSDSFDDLVYHAGPSC